MTFHGVGMDFFWNYTLTALLITHVHALPGKNTGMLVYHSERRMCSSRKYPYYLHRGFSVLHPPSPRKLLGISSDLLWGEYGFCSGTTQCSWLKDCGHIVSQPPSKLFFFFFLTSLSYGHYLPFLMINGQYLIFTV